MILIGDIFPADEVNLVVTGHNSHEYIDAWGSYWEVCIHIAEMNGNYISRLDEYSHPSNRTCGICGLVHNTNNFGEAPRNCESHECASVRLFWKFSDSLCRPIRSGGVPKSAKVTRNNWLNNCLRTTYGFTNIYELPLFMRLPILASMRLARISLEARLEHDGRINAAGSGCDDSAEIRIDNSRPGQGNSGSSESVSLQRSH